MLITPPSHQQTRQWMYLVNVRRAVWWFYPTCSCTNEPLPLRRDLLVPFAITRVYKLSFLFLFLLCPSSPLLSLLSLFSISLGDNTKWPTRVDMSLNLNTINQLPRYQPRCILTTQMSILWFSSKSYRHLQSSFNGLNIFGTVEICSRCR